MSTPTQTRQPESARTVLASNGFWTQVVVFLLGTWLGAGVLLLLQPLFGVSPDLIMLTQFGPSLGVLAVVLVRRAQRRRTVVAVSLRPTGMVLRRIAAGVGILVVVLGMSAAVLTLIGRPVHLMAPGRLSVSLWLLAPLQFVGACGEELGWRAFLQRHLQTRWSMTVAALVVGTLWATWHVEYYGFGPVFFGAFWLSCLSMSLMMAQLVRGSGQGVLLIAGTFHWLLNLGTLMVLDVSGGDLLSMLVLAGTMTAAAAVVPTAARVRTMRR